MCGQLGLGEMPDALMQAVEAIAEGDPTGFSIDSPVAAADLADRVKG